MPTSIKDEGDALIKAHVKGHYRRVGGKKVHVKPHERKGGKKAKAKAPKKKAAVKAETDTASHVQFDEKIGRWRVTTAAKRKALGKDFSVALKKLSRGYITDNERERASRDIKHFVEGHHPLNTIYSALGNQPFNIKVKGIIEKHLPGVTQMAEDKDKERRRRGF